jgi:NADPH-dependent ferric siderophore reductase
MSGSLAVRRISHPLTPRVLTVSGVRRLGSRLVRVTLTGPELAGFVTAAPTDHVRLFFPAERDARPRLPSHHTGGHRAAHADGTVDPGRIYTVREFRADSGELDVDIVLHGDGVATRWASGAGPGDRLGVLGPRNSLVVPPDLDWYLFAVDETGLPAAARWVGELPPTARAIVLAEVTGPADEIRFTTRADLTVSWLRSGLERAVRATDLPPGDGFVWAAGEATLMRQVRRHLRDESRLDPAGLDVNGYWKRGVADRADAGVD